MSTDLDGLLTSPPLSFDASIPVIVIAGDFNSLDTDFLERDFGLLQIVNKPTHGNRILDKFFTNRPEISYWDVLSSLIKTKHKAVYVEQHFGSARKCEANDRQKSSFYDLRQHHIDALRYHLGIHDWSSILSCDNIQTVYDQFLQTVKWYIELCIPVTTVRIGRRDPDYISPVVKVLLNKRNKLRRSGRSAAADQLALRINDIIAGNVRSRLRKLADAPVSEMWKALRLHGYRDDSSSSRTRNLLLDLENVNKYFADISFNPQYKESDVMAFLSNVSYDESAIHELSAFEVEIMLRRVTKTAPGRDNLPFWLFKLCSYELAEVVAHMYNCSLRSSTLPQQWLTAVITPVPKTACPSSLSDFRPISVTPILSRIIEKYIANQWLEPAIRAEHVSDQFAFRRTGSTTCALVYMLHHVTRLLESNAYVRCLSVDFSKAFDRVDHAVLVQKLSKLSMPGCILNWLINFLTGRSHTTKSYGMESNPLPINLSIVQGSGLGPKFYIVLASDLKPISRVNLIFKYADDTNLLVPEHTDVQLQEEFQAIQKWAINNKMVINASKTKEIVFHRPNPRMEIVLSPLPGIQQVTEIKLLGVIFSDSLRFDSHVDFILKTCSQRSYIIKRFRDQGLSLKQLSIIFDAVILSRIMYASSAWCGFLSRELSGRLDGFLKRMNRYGYCQYIYNFELLCRDRDETLFAQVRKPGHCLNVLLPHERIMPMTLRPRKHNYVVPDFIYEQFKSSFINRCLSSVI